MVGKDKQVKTVKTHVGFGTGADRFKFVSHPKLDTNGVYVKSSPWRGPAKYYPKNIDEIYRINKNRKSEPWTHKKKLEDWSAHLGYRKPEVLSKRKRQATFLGPAWYEVREAQKYKPACDNMTFGRTTRFPSSKQHCTPAPGTYHKMKAYKAPYGPHSSRPTFEREPACRFKDTTPYWKPDPCRYHVIDKDSIEMKPKKLVSLRGPYELFTVVRELSTIISKTNMNRKVGAKTWPLSLPGSLETYKKSSYGKFNKTNMQVPYRGRNALNDLSMRIHRVGEPGPGDYNILPSKNITQNKYAFNSSYDKPRSYKRAIVWPGVGRYNVKVKDCGIFGQGFSHVFNSKVPTGCPPPQQLNAF